ncbi:hypothetical protein A5804_002941 [Enterococcus faecium]|uniref:Lipoprotein n=1 Tax=Enterococcus faecium TaxID=1352 RepID=A0AB73N072_ENTFC|nr:hypothetical protein [Enterococcus faecium]OTN93486.1 hypothetical protein A5804_002941 [Enterococcus faecium]
MNNKIKKKVSLFILLGSLGIVTISGCTKPNQQKTKSTETKISHVEKEEQTKEVSKEEMEKDINLLTNLMYKNTLLDTMIGNIGYNILQDPDNPDTAGAMGAFSQYFLEEMYQPTKELYDTSLQELSKAGYEPKETERYLALVRERDKILEEGRAILLKLNENNGSGVAKEYEQYVSVHDFQKLGANEGMALSEMVSTKYPNQEEAKKIVTESLKNSMEKFGDPVDYENIFGEEPENSDIKKVYDELNLNK